LDERDSFNPRDRDKRPLIARRKRRNRSLQDARRQRDHEFADLGAEVPALDQHRGLELPRDRVQPRDEAAGAGGVRA
jgi:hypothetical protein